MDNKHNDMYHEEPEQARPDILDDFEVTRGEVYSHTREPGFSLNDGKVQVNTACIRKMADVDYIQILINRDEKMLLLRACTIDDHEAVVVTDEHTLQMEISGKSFLKKLCQLLSWDDNTPRMCYGEYIPAHRALRFDLRFAQPLSVEKF